MRGHRRWLGALLLLVVAIGVSGVYFTGVRGGPVLRTVMLGVAPGMVAVDAATNRAFVQNYRDQSVSVLEASSGRVLRTVPIGDFNAFLVVDVPTNRISWEVTTRCSSPC